MLLSNISLMIGQLLPPKVAVVKLQNGGNVEAQEPRKYQPTSCLFVKAIVVVSQARSQHADDFVHMTFDQVSSTTMHHLMVSTIVNNSR